MVGAMGLHYLAAHQGGYFAGDLRVRRKIKLDWIDIARPHHGYGLLASGLNWHSAWAVFRWMVETEHSLVLWSKWYSGGPSPANIEKRTDALFLVVGRKLKESHNSCHPRATTIKKVHLVVKPDRFELDLWYSYARDKYSGWHLYIKHTGTFFEFLQHAEAELARLLVPVSEDST